MQPKFCITREKHLDHMVKVVPFIVTGYALQCYFIMQMQPQGFAVDSLMFLGCCLVFMIGVFISYDLKHRVEFHENELVVSFSWFNYEEKISYEDIKIVGASEKDQTFATLYLELKNGKKFGFYFVDDADKIKQWLEGKISPSSKMAA